MPHSWSDPVIGVHALRAGGVRVGAFPAAAAGLARIPIPGGTVFVDPATPHCPPAAELADPATAADTVTWLYGAAVTHACLELENAGLDATASIARQVDFAPTADLSDLARLGTLAWLAGHSAQPLHPHLLTLETLDQAWTCRHLLEDPDGPGEDLVASADALLTLARSDPDRVCQPPVRALVARVLAALSAQLPYGDPRQEALARALGAADDEAAREAGPGPWGDEPWWQELLASCSSPGAVHATGDTGPAGMFSGSATAHWARNTHGTISRDEDAVTWSVEFEGDTRARVAVVASRARRPLPVCQPDLPAVPVAGTLALLRGQAGAPATGLPVSGFSVHSPAWPLPLAQGLLELHPQAGTLAGLVVLDGPAVEVLRSGLRDGTLRVDAHDAGVAYPHLRAQAPVVEEAHRWSARGIGATRLALAAPGAARAQDLRRAARSALVRAETLWLACADTGDVPASLAYARAAHCRGFARLAQPVTHGIPALDEVPAGYAPPVSAAWAGSEPPTLTERALFDSPAT